MLPTQHKNRWKLRSFVYFYPKRKVFTMISSDLMAAESIRLAPSQKKLTSSLLAAISRLYQKTGRASLIRDDP